MNYAQKNTPVSLNMDKARKQLSPTEAFYLLNHERYLNLHGNNGANIGKTTGLYANYPACEMDQPAGENNTVGIYRSPITNEVYSWHYNSNGAHYILRITNKGCELVYFGPCLFLSADPRHSIEQFRVYLRVEKTCKNRHGKYLVWTNGKHDIGHLDVEASIATNSFSTPFFDRCLDGCELTTLCVPKPCGCIQAEYIPYKKADQGLTNKLLDVGFKFMYRHVYYDGRASEWSDRSTLYYLESRGCFDSGEGMPRCMKLRIPIGNPLVEKIEIAYSTDNGATWYVTEVIEKYKAYNNSQQMWYERGLSEIVMNGYSEEDCSFDYKFCNDRQCDVVDPKLASRVMNPIPREAQGLIPIKDAIGFYNYKKGTCPLPVTEFEKIKIEPNCEDNPNCSAEYVTVTVRAIIHNFYKDKNQFLYHMNSDPNSTVWFGGLNDQGLFGGGGGFDVGYEQSLHTDRKNFCVYIEGTDIWAEMKQYKSAAWFPLGSRKSHGLVLNMDDGDVQDEMDSFTDDGGFFYQEAKLRVRKGTKGFLRLVSHQAANGARENQDTSTFVIGIHNLYNYEGNRNNMETLMEPVEEIYFTTCDGKDVDIPTAFVIEDNAEDGGLKSKASAAHGYVTDAGGKPIVNAIVRITNPLGEREHSRTDHNGFWHMTMMAGFTDTVDAQIMMEKDCTVAAPLVTFKVAKTFQLSMIDGVNVRSDQTVSEDDWSELNSNFYIEVQVNVRDCEGAGVAGVRVALSGVKYETTAPDGTARFKIRNHNERNLSLRAVLMDHKGCLEFDCDKDCTPCLPEVTGNAPACFNKVNGVIQKLVLGSMQINRAAAITNRRGLKNGGRYGFGVIAEGACGRLSAVYENVFINIPRAQQSGDVMYCGFKYSLTKPIKFLEEWVDCLKIVRTKNLNPFELQWSVDKIERLAGSKIRLTIQSLNDYNASYNFKTNTVYQYVQGDRIEFIRNGDGKIFPIAEGVLNYKTLSPFHDKNVSGQEEAPADFFNQLLIDDDGRLDNLKEGAVIEMQRLPDCETQPTYYEICASIPVVNGELVYESGTFFTFDTYLVNREIGQMPSQSFEHHSPNDFWAMRMDDTGKAHVVNKYEDEKRYGRNMSINAPNQFNYFGDLEKTFDAPEQGDITAMGISDGKVILAIGENDNFLAQVADDLLRVGQDGVIRALPSDAVVSGAEPKIRGQFGCQYPHIGSIYFGDGYVTWVDVNHHGYIMHDYNEAKDVSDMRVKTYFRKRCQEIEAHNRKHPNDFMNHYRFATGRNHATEAIYTTIKTLRQSGINNEIEAFKKPNDTIAYHPASNDWLSFVSFTPEAYTQLDIFDGNGCAFITYLNGIPYIHPMKYDKFNEFYGVAVDRVVGITLNDQPEKIKTGLAIEIQDNTMWFIPKGGISTDDPNFESEIPPIRWKGLHGKWNAEFLNNARARGGLYGNHALYGGERTRGYHINCIFVRDNTDGLKYGTSDNKKRVQYDELDMILFKYQVVEQSGFTQNL